MKAILAVGQPVQTTLEKILASRGHDVTSFEPSAVAAFLQQKMQPVLVFATLNEEGAACFKMFRKSPYRPAATLVAILPAEDQALIESAIEEGADDYLTGDMNALQLSSRIAFLEHIQSKRADSEARATAILETTVDGVITIDERGQIESFNAAAERIFGYTAEEAIGRNVSMLMPEPYHTEHDDYLLNYRHTGQAKIIGIGREVAGRRKDGSIFPLDLAVSEVRMKGGRLFTGIVRDISERRRLEQEILRVSDQERWRIGQDLHDELGQMLTGTGLIAQDLARRAGDDGRPIAGEIQEIADLIKEADHVARTLARGLLPVKLEHNGLSSAVRKLAETSGRLFGLECIFNDDEVVDELDDTAAGHLYRIAQEAISNAARHGRASRVVISVSTRQQQVVLRIEDNGNGFPEKYEQSTGMGVRLMHYRSQIIGGALSINRNAAGGTTVSCSIPGVIPEPT